MAMPIRRTRRALPVPERGPGQRLAHQGPELVQDDQDEEAAPASKTRPAATSSLAAGP